MLLKIFSLIYDPIYGGFNDSSIQEFLKDKQIIAINEYLISHHQIHSITFIIKYLPLYQDIVTSTKKQTQVRDESWKENLSHQDLGIFNQLRSWRTEKSKKDGVPSYIIFHNRQLSIIARDRPQSLTDLAKIEGIGQAKIEKYGSEILQITKVENQVQNEKS